jgi:tetratricopeptide (TPR) repeat protein
MKKNLIIIGLIALVIVLIIGIGAYFLSSRNTNQENTDLEKLRVEKPELSSLIDEVEKWSKALIQDSENFEYYVSLGLAWKALGDATKEPKYYEEALDVYNEIVEKSDRTNSLYLHNAGMILKKMNRFDDAEKYFQEALEINPGDAMLYIALVELYEYNMKKPKEDIIAVYDQGIENIIFPEILEQRKSQYLKRVKSK